jgi:hypothetical protein
MRALQQMSRRKPPMSPKLSFAVGIVVATIVAVCLTSLLMWNHSKRELTPIIFLHKLPDDLGR